MHEARAWSRKADGAVVDISPVNPVPQGEGEVPGRLANDMRDAGSPQVKRVRVVTTVEYFLKD